MTLDLTVLPDELAICRLPPRSDLPAWVLPDDFASVAWTPEELVREAALDDAKSALSAAGHRIG